MLFVLMEKWVEILGQNILPKMSTDPKLKARYLVVILTNCVEW